MTASPVKTIYNQWLEYLPLNIEEAKEYLKKTKFPYNVNSYLLSEFYQTLNREKNFEINDCIFVDFPLKEKAQIIDNFVSNPYLNPHPIIPEIVKLIYYIWPECMTDVRYSKQHLNTLNPYSKIIFENLYSIKAKLKAMKHTTAATQYMSGEAYLNWHLLGFLPLLGDQGIDIMHNVSKLNYEDAQDMLMFGLYQYEPKYFYNDLKKIFMYWHENQNIQLGSGTGIIGQLQYLITKYKKHNIDILKDPDLKRELKLLLN